MNMISKDAVVSKALNLIGKLQKKYGFKPKFYAIENCRPLPSVQDDELPTIFEEDIIYDDVVGIQLKPHNTFVFFKLTIKL